MVPALRFAVLMSVGLSLTALLSVGCGSSGGGSGTGGVSSIGGATSTGGTTGIGGATGIGGTTSPPFMAVNPCPTADSYTTTGTTITFGSTYMYDPKCLKIKVGTAVTFMGAGTATFNDHPFHASTMRGTQTGSPLMDVMNGDSAATFTFSSPGFFAYNCLYHGNDTPNVSDNYMSGVVWVE